MTGEQFRRHRRESGRRRDTIGAVRSRFADERGIALVMALGIMLVLTVLLAGAITLSTAGARHAQRSNAGQKAYSLAEAALNNAVSVLNATYPSTFPGPPATQCVLRPQTPLPADIPGVTIAGAVACASVSPYSTAPDPARP